MGLEHSEEQLGTNDPIALRYLMSEMLFDLGKEQDADTADSEPVTSTNKKPELSFLGQNSSGFLFVFQDPSIAGQHRLPEAEMEAFEKILAALKLSLVDVALINIAGPQEPTVEQLLEYFQPLNIVLLGTQVTIDQSQVTWPELTLHQLYTAEEREPTTSQNLQILQSYSFAEMMDDVAKKRTFWTLLKALLG